MERKAMGDSVVNGRTVKGAGQGREKSKRG